MEVFKPKGRWTGFSTLMLLAFAWLFSPKFAARILNDSVGKRLNKMEADDATKNT
ncbi:hypothetical protein NFHSH190041_20030 [Shewanella sp. NFH-SH190041]|nr:hypothetical protein NFHSH190041_20030 [Shewanella sp. NFH-SH190041]